jgi:hypothetical protein
MARCAEKRRRRTVWIEEAPESGQFRFEAWGDRRPACSDERHLSWEKVVGGDERGWHLSW